jgi:tetratricopeptide (TPR) repeat protein
MAQFAGGPFTDETGGDDELWRAQEVMYDAWDAGQKRARIALAKRALGISSLCADAYVLLAEEAAKSIVEARDYYAKGVEAGEKALGEGAFERDVGHFWGLLETRPYMRARAGLAETLWSLGERTEAVAHWRDMLRLNPNDNQGIHHVLASRLLIIDDHEALEALIGQYDDDVFAEWAYGKVLLAFRQEGASQGTRDKLKAAWNRNAHVPGYLLGARRLPPGPPGPFPMRNWVAGMT